MLQVEAHHSAMVRGLPVSVSCSYQPWMTASLVLSHYHTGVYL
jgi:hypothetical protein